MRNNYHGTKQLETSGGGWMQCTAGKAVVFSRNRARSRDQTKAECPWGALGKDGTPLLGGIPLLRRLPEADCPPLRTLTPLTNPAMQVCNNMLLVRKRSLRTNQLNSHWSVVCVLVSSLEQPMSSQTKLGCRVPPTVVY